MERYNPFSSEPIGDEASTQTATLGQRVEDASQPQRALTSRYSTSFPDPLHGVVDEERPKTRSISAERGAVASEEFSSRSLAAEKRLFVSASEQQQQQQQQQQASQRSNSVTFLNRTSKEFFDDDDDATIAQAGGRPLSSTRANTAAAAKASSGPSLRLAGRQTSSAGGFSSLLNRATSVTDRVSGAVESAVRSTVDTISTQIQQAVPVGQTLNERLAAQASPLASQSSGASAAAAAAVASGSQAPQMSLISRQRVVLILDRPSCVDWPQQFVQYRRLTAGPQTSASSLSSFFSAQFSSGSASSLSPAGHAAADHAGDLIEQASFTNVSVLANQASSSAAIRVLSSASNAGSIAATRDSLGSSPKLQQQQQQQPSIQSTGQALKIIRPEYVVIRQRIERGDKFQQLNAIVKALEYCAVPLFEPYNIWHTLQDKQLIFAKLLQVQRRLGKQQFPLIPQLYCQTHQDLLNYINTNSQTIRLPCLIRSCQLYSAAQGGKMRCDSLQMLRDFATIMQSSASLSCTIEQYLDVKCDLIVQKLGTSLKMFKKTQQTVATSAKADKQYESVGAQSQRPQAANRQSSLGAGVLSTLISSAGQQVSRRSSQPQTPVANLISVEGAQYERVSGDVSQRYRDWVEAISEAFEHKIDVFAIKIVVATNDREYVVGLRNCSMDFLGTAENQDEDRRSFVELILSKMNTVLPKQHSAAQVSQAASRQSSNIEQMAIMETSSVGSRGNQLQDNMQHCADLQDKAQQNQTADCRATTNFGQLSSRSKSVSINQSESFNSSPSLSTGCERPRLLDSQTDRFSSLARRGSDLAPAEASSQKQQVELGSQTNGSTTVAAATSGAHQRQHSLGQSIFDQTSTALSSFFKRLEASDSFSRAPTSVDSSASTSFASPPQSARLPGSDKFGQFGMPNTYSQAGDIEQANRGQQRGAGIKSQSMDCSSARGLAGSPRSSMRRAQAPPKPPPPQLPGSFNRQTSLASPGLYRAQTGAIGGGGGGGDGVATPNSTPVRTRQNIAVNSSTSEPEQSSQRIVRQNSALSAFEPFDSDLKAAQGKAPVVGQLSHPSSLLADSGGCPQAAEDSSSKKRASQTFDSASIKSGDSIGTNGTTESSGIAEDTMNNLKKTFASIFGDKCE